MQIQNSPSTKYFPNVPYDVIDFIHLNRMSLPLWTSKSISLKSRSIDLDVPYRVASESASTVPERKNEKHNENAVQTA